MKKRILPFFCLVTIISGLSVPASAQPAGPGISPDDIYIPSAMNRPVVFANNNTTPAEGNISFYAKLSGEYSFRGQENNITNAHKINNRLQEYPAAGFGAEEMTDISAESFDELNICYHPIQFVQSYREP